ncbi:serine hydrolase [Pararhodobacter aggregans]
MTTRFGRWFRGFGVIGMTALVAVMVILCVAPRAHAQPFAAVVMDARTGEILYQTDNSTSRLHPASLTKMMTLYIAFEALQNGEITEDTPVRISRHAASQPPSRLGLRAGQTIAFRYLIRAAALRSANDAAVAIAEALEGSVPAFAERMNRTARAIGMSRTTFRNPHGLTTDGHLSTARDMSILGRQLYFDYPSYYGIFSRRSDNAGIATVNNTNRLFLGSYRGADGIKTGFTNAAGYNLTAMAERDGVRLLVTVFGARSSQDRLRRVSQLMDRGFRDAPRRAAVRRPARPDYVRGADDRGSGPAAGRVIRLQTAPTTSRFPRARPQPGDAPAAELIAALSTGIDELIEEIREPDPASDTDDPGVAPGVTSEEPEESDAPEGLAEAVEQVLVAAVAPERSPLPRGRPVDEAVTLAAAEPAEAEEEIAIAARSGSGLLGTEDYVALAESGVQVPVTPPARPEDLVAALVEDLPADGPEAPAGEAMALADVSTDGGALTIPGLPPIPLADGAEAPEAQPEAQLAALEAPAEAPLMPSLEPVASELSVDDDGRILWRDEELLQALSHEDPEEPVLAPTIVLTSSSDADVVASTPTPEIVTHVSTSGGRLWRVELGRFNTPFDAERVLLRVALSEAGTLRNGVRRVTARGGRHVAEVNSLTHEEAQLACLRLAARDQDCTVVDPS